MKVNFSAKYVQLNTHDAPSQKWIPESLGESWFTVILPFFDSHPAVVSHSSDMPNRLKQVLWIIMHILFSTTLCR